MGTNANIEREPQGLNSQRARAHLHSALWSARQGSAPSREAPKLMLNASSTMRDSEDAGLGAGATRPRARRVEYEGSGLLLCSLALHLRIAPSLLGSTTECQLRVLFPSLGRGRRPKFQLEPSAPPAGRPLSGQPARSSRRPALALETRAAGGPRDPAGNDISA